MYRWCLFLDLCSEQCFCLIACLFNLETRNAMAVLFLVWETPALLTPRRLCWFTLPAAVNRTTSFPTSSPALDVICFSWHPSRGKMEPQSNFMHLPMLLSAHRLLELLPDFMLDSDIRQHWEAWGREDGGRTPCGPPVCSMSGSLLYSIFMSAAVTKVAVAESSLFLLQHL